MIEEKIIIMKETIMMVEKIMGLIWIKNITTPIKGKDIMIQILIKGKIIMGNIMKVIMKIKIMMNRIMMDMVLLGISSMMMDIRTKMVMEILGGS